MNGVNSVSGGIASTQRIDRLTSDGFVLLHDLGDSQFAGSVLSACKRKINDIRCALGDREVGIGSAAGYEEIVQRSPGRWDVPVSMTEFGLNDHDLPWWPLITALLGRDAEHSFSGVVSSEPASPTQFWHTDSPHLSAEHLDPHALNVMVALQDVSMQMGPTECARGSHVLTNHIRNPMLKIDELVYQHAGTTPASLVEGTELTEPEGVSESMPIGSCLIFDDRLLHRGLANQTDATRHIAYFSYRRKGYIGDTHFEAEKSVFDTSD